VRIIAHALAWLLSLLFPGSGQHRVETRDERQGDELPDNRRQDDQEEPADEHQDDQAEPRIPLFERPGREHPEARMFKHQDDPTLIRAYYLPRISDEEQQQIERRQALLLALDGIDVGPEIIHGVHVGAAR
jgi:hypothetical protein